MSKSNTSRQTADVYQMVTDRIIEAMEQGIIPWRKTWKGGFLFAQNYVTNHVYQGINAILTNLSPYDTPFFMTFLQVKERGGMIKKGAKSIPIVYWIIGYKDQEGKVLTQEEAQNTTDSVKFMYPRYFRIFNIEDIEGIEFEIPNRFFNHFEPIDRCEKIIAGMPNRPTLDFRYRKSASYNVFEDRVKMPQKEQFDTVEDFYATLWHEIIHATGHSSRLNREEVMQVTEFGSLTYSREELLAEIGAAFLCNITGIETPAISRKCPCIYSRLVAGTQK